jgi:Fe-S oxidoreductase
MEPLQLIALLVSLSFTVVGVTLFARMTGHIVSVVRGGAPAHRTDQFGARLGHMASETLLHTRMLQWSKVGAAHWFIMVGFGLLFLTLVTAYGQLFDAHFALPVIGHFVLFEWATEFFAWAMIIAIVPLMIYRFTRPKQRVRGEAGRFYGSNMWQGFFVEWVILLVGACIVKLRGLEYALTQYSDHPERASLLHFPLTAWLGSLVDGWSEPALANVIWLIATAKIVVSMTWMIVLGRNATMGVAWHRFTAPFNILFKREASGGTALGAVTPLMIGGRALTLDDLEDLPEDASLGVGKAEDFTWKARLDFTSCTECGRCQSQCPAWNTEKPLSPKLLITALRDHTYARASGGEADRPLIGEPGITSDAAYSTDFGVIDPDALWACTSCGACVQQCPVDIEHVDHIIDMRRYQLLVESNFPAELTGLFRGLESRGNPWNMSPQSRLDWAQGLDFDVPVVGDTVESLDDVDWLFWVGCAGAYEDRAKKTTRAVAELLHLAGVSYAVLGNGETCTGDPARRAGNEFVFAGLAAANVETFRERRVKQVVSTCAHCFNTLKNEYSQFGIELEVVHHTQLLNRLVREGRLTPIPVAAPKRKVTYHDPCFLGRHNQVYSPPRELLTVLPGADFVEMPRNSERSFCCGAGGARMWMEEKIGERINNNRTAEAIATGADQIAVGCPFCRVMLSDGLTAAQASGAARDEVEVLDVAQLLLSAVKRDDPARAHADPDDPARNHAPAADAARSAVPSAPAATAIPDATAAPGSLFDVLTPPAPEAEPARTPTSLFDLPTPPTPAPEAPTSLFDVPTPPAPEAQPAPTSLFDVPTPPAPEAQPPAAEGEPHTVRTDVDINALESLFDL